MKRKTFKTNTLYNLANEYRKHMTDESEIELIDMTDILEKEEEEHIKNGEIIIENINGKMRLGKSTMAMARGVRIFKLLKKHGMKPKNESFNMTNIARDDQEFSKMMRSAKLNNTVIVTDESNELEQTGENVTAENALKKVFSDVQAGRYVHRICCSPKDTIDENADILLNVIAIDKINKITRSKLYYKYYEGGQEYTQLLGYVDTYVGDIIKNWETIKRIFLKEEKTEKEKKKIEELRKKDWYVEYTIKKYEKMELITKEGIFKPRILDYATIILTVIGQLKPLCKLTTIINKDIIRNYVKMQFRKNKIPQSMIGEKLATDETSGVLDIWKAYWKTTRTIKKTSKMLEKTNGKGREIIQEELKELMELRETLRQTGSIQEEELRHYETINKKYHGDVK